MKAYIENDLNHKKWDENLSEIACAINTLKHTTTLHTPYEVLYGFSMKLSGVEHSGPLEDDVHTSEERKSRIQAIRKAVEKNIRTIQSRRRCNYNLRARERSHVEGEEVWIRNKKQSDKAQKYAKKLAPRYNPAIVERRLARHIYQVRDGGKIPKVFPAQHIK